MLDRSLKRLAKKSRRGFRGYPLATVAAYGPDDRRASRLVASVSRHEGDEPELRKWFSDTTDVRSDPRITAEVLQFIQENGVLSVAASDRIIGCPHEEGIDYEGEYCPRFPFWIGRDRWTGKLVSDSPS
jgi:hypothetical protein